MAVKFSDANVATLEVPAGKSELLVFDEVLSGFGVRIRAGGKRTWILQYRLGIQQRRLSLGSVSSIDAAEARRRAKFGLAQVQLGQDPQADKIAARTPKAPEMTIGELVERYLPFAENRLKASTFSGVTLHLRKHWRHLHDHEVPTLERRHVAAELSRIAQTSGLYGANRSRAALSRLFSWAIGEGLADRNPVAGTNRATEEVSRDRVLSDQELSAIWQNAGDGDYARIIRILVLTGQRREEVGGMRWQEVDAPKAIWSIPSERTKNGLPHDVPLSKAVFEVIQLQIRDATREHVFGARLGSFQGWSGAKRRLDERIAEANGGKPIPAWRVHDIRRTVATRLGDIGTLPHTIEALLNHISGSRAGVAGTYNRSLYNAEKRRALDLWADHLAKLIQSPSDHNAPKQS